MNIIIPEMVEEIIFFPREWQSEGDVQGARSARRGISLQFLVANCNESEVGNKSANHHSEGAPETYK